MQEITGWVAGNPGKHLLPVELPAGTRSAAFTYVLDEPADVDKIEIVGTLGDSSAWIGWENVYDRQVPFEYHIVVSG